MPGGRPGDSSLCQTSLSEQATLTFLQIPVSPCGVWGGHRAHIPEGLLKMELPGPEPSSLPRATLSLITTDTK